MALFWKAKRRRRGHKHSLPKSHIGRIVKSSCHSMCVVVITRACMESVIDVMKRIEGGAADGWVEYTFIYQNMGHEIVDIMPLNMTPLMMSKTVKGRPAWGVLVKFLQGDWCFSYHLMTSMTKVDGHHQCYTRFYDLRDLMVLDSFLWKYKLYIFFHFQYN